MRSAVLDRGTRIHAAAPRLRPARRHRELMVYRRLGLDNEDTGVPLTASTEVKSPAEEACKRVLLAAGILTLYEIHEFTVGDGIHLYKPDFATELTMGGKPVIIEPHGFASKGRVAAQLARSLPEGEIETALRTTMKDARERRELYLEKIRGFREVHGAYTVLISHAPGKGTKDFVAEYWRLAIMHRDPDGKYRAAQRRLARLMEGLILRSDTPGILHGNSAMALQELQRAA